MEAAMIEGGTLEFHDQSWSLQNGHYASFTLQRVICNLLRNSFLFHCKIAIRNYQKDNFDSGLRGFQLCLVSAGPQPRSRLSEPITWTCWVSQELTS